MGTDQHLSVPNLAPGLWQDGGKALISSWTEEVTLSGATTDSTAQIPANSLVLGLTWRVTTSITFGGGGATWQAGISGDTDRFQAASSSVTEDDTGVGLNHHGTAGNLVNTTAQSVRFAPDTGTFSAGAIRVTLFYISFTAPAA